jgi:hypothetical protein
MAQSKWQLIFAYQRLVNAGEAKGILCPNCNDNDLVSVIDPDNSEPVPALWCYYCDKTVKPGIAFWDQISAAVNDR